MLTKHHNGCRGAASLSHDVASQACVVGRVGQTGLVDDKVVVGTCVDVVVSD